MRSGESASQGRVIHCADYAGPYAGAFVPMLAAATREALSRGLAVTICLSAIAQDRPWLSELQDLAELRFIRTAGVRSGIRELWSLAALSSEPLAIHTHFTTFDVAAALMRLRRGRTAIFWHEQSALVDSPRARLRNGLRYSVLGPLVDGILCVSPEIRVALQARHAPPGKLSDFPNAVDIDRLTPITAEERSAAREALELAEDARVVLHFGWDWRRKGGDLMLAATDLLTPDPRLVVLTVLGEDGGSGAPSELSTHRAVRALSPTNDVRRLYAAADVFLSCSRAEGMPFAVLEALARGLPVVATGLPVQRELLAGLPGGEAVSDDPADLSRAIQALLALTHAERAEHAALARERIAASFAIEAWARRLVDLDAAVLGLHARRATPA